MCRVLVLCCLVVLYPTGAVQCAQVYETEHSNPRSWLSVVPKQRHHSEETESVFVKSVCAAKSDLAEKSPDALDVKLVCDSDEKRSQATFELLLCFLLWNNVNCKSSYVNSSSSSLWEALLCEMLETIPKLVYKAFTDKPLENAWCWTAINSTSKLHALRLFKNRCAELPTSSGVPCFNPSTGRCSWDMEDGCASVLMAKFSLFMLGSLDEKKLLDYRAACWLPELQSTALLYHTPGRWEVDDQCISTVQRVLSKTLSFLIGGFLQPPPVDMEERSYVRYFPMALYQAVLESSDKLFQYFVYPAFKRLRHTAALRRNVQSPVIVVTCAGLRGTRDEAIEATERLLRLLLVNETQYLGNNRSFITYMLSSILNHILPCAVRQAI